MDVGLIGTKFEPAATPVPHFGVTVTSERLENGLFLESCVIALD
jgi:hypothetical protein